MPSRAMEAAETDAFCVDGTDASVGTSLVLLTSLVFAIDSCCGGSLFPWLVATDSGEEVPFAIGSELLALSDGISLS